VPDMRSIAQMLRLRTEQGATREELEVELRSDGPSGRLSGTPRGRPMPGVNQVTQSHEMKIAILALATRVMDAIEERSKAEAALVAPYHEVVRKTADTVQVGGESLSIERDSVSIDERVEIAGKFLRMVQRTDGDYEATITEALARFADLMER
jgi:hypothetical protein